MGCGSAMPMYGPAGARRGHCPTPRVLQMSLFGARAYVSSGLPGAEWWVAGSANIDPRNADVELDDVGALYAENNLRQDVFAWSK